MAQWGRGDQGFFMGRDNGSDGGRGGPILGNPVKYPELK